MNENELKTHYMACAGTALIVGVFVGTYNVGMGFIMAILTFLAVSAIQVQYREYTSNRHNEPPK